MQLRHLLLGIIVLTGLAASAGAQVRWRVSAGMSTDWITNDNPAVHRLTGTSDSIDAPLGGALDGMQMGWGIRAYADLDKQKTFRIPFGLDYFSYSGTQSMNAPTYAVQVRHDVNLFTGHLGFEWSFVEFPLAFARAYIAGEVRGLYVAPNTITTSTRIVSDSGHVTSRQEVFSGKEGAFRLGGMARLGIEGEIYYPVFLNTSVAYGVMNLVGRDMRSTADGGRGELLTPNKMDAAGEGLLYHLNFTFMVQVRL